MRQQKKQGSPGLRQNAKLRYSLDRSLPLLARTNPSSKPSIAVPSVRTSTKEPLYPVKRDAPWTLRLWAHIGPMNTIVRLL